MPKYLSGRVKRTPQGSLTTDRYQYLGLEQAEPNLGDPANPLPNPPGGSQFQIISVRERPGERFWIPLTGGIQPGAITVREEGVVVPPAGINSTSDINFKGQAITVEGFLKDNGDPGSAVTVTVAPPGNDHGVLFNNDGEFATSEYFTFDNTIGIGSVGIGTTTPTQNLHVVGNVKLDKTIYGEDNEPGNTGDLLVKTATGGVVWTNQNSVEAGAGGTIGQIQFHGSTGLIDGADKFYYDFNNDRVGIGSTQPTELLDVLGISRFDGQVRIESDLNVTGVSTFSDDVFTGVGATVGIGSTVFFGDNVRAIFGDSGDLEIGHIGNQNIIEDKGNGALLLRTNGSSIALQRDTGATMLTAVPEADVRIFYNGNKKFATSGVGATVYGQLDVYDVYASGVGNTAVVSIGNTDNLRLLHNSTEGVIENNYGELILDGKSGAIVFKTSVSQVERLRIHSDGKIQIDGDDVTNIYDGANDLIIGESGESSEKGITIANNSTASIRFNDDSDAGIIEYSHPFDLMKFSAGGSEGFRIDGSGNAKITGIATVGAALTVGSNLEVNGDILPKTHKGGNIGKSGSFSWDKIYADQFIGQIQTTQENLEINQLKVTGVSTFVGLSTFKDGIIVESGISTFNDHIKGNGDTNISGISSVSADKVLVGSAIEHSLALPMNPVVQIKGTTDENSSLALYRYGNDGGSPFLTFVKSRNSSIGGIGRVVNGDLIGRIQWNGSDSNDIANTGAEIYARVTGNISGSTSDMPMSLHFRTSPDNLSNPEDRMVIRENGNIGIGTSVPNEALDVNGAIRLRGNNETTYAAVLKANYDSTHVLSLESYHNSDTAFEVIGTHADSGGANVRVVIAKDGQNVGIGSTIPSSELDVEGSGKFSGDLSVVGVSTFSDDIFIGVGATVGIGSTVFFGDDVKLKFGGSDGLEIYHSETLEGTNDSYIDSSARNLYIRLNTEADNGGNIALQAKKDSTGILIEDGDAVKLYFDAPVNQSTDGLRLATTGYGVTIFGTTETQSLNVTGVSTFADNIFVGTGATVGFGSTAYFASDVNLTGNLTISNNAPRITFTDGNHNDFAIIVDGDDFNIQDTTAGENRLNINSSGVVSCNDGLSVTGNMTATGNLLRTGTGQDIGASNASWNKVYASEFIGQVNTTQENITTGQIKVTGLSTFMDDAQFDKDVLIKGTLTYEDVTNIDSIGIITARKDVHVGAGLSVVGVSTFFDEVNILGSVGIGTTVPDQLVHILDLSGGNRIMNIESTATSGAFLAFLDVNTTDETKVRVGTKGGNKISIRGDEHHFESGAGVSRAIIDSGGKMGLGVTPTGIFDIIEDNNPQLTLRSDSHADNGGGRLNFAVGVSAAPADGNTICSIASTIHSTSGGTLKGDMKFYTNGGDDLEERLRITAGGNVNIGGNYTQTSYQMRVTGTVAATHFDSLSDLKLKTNVKQIQNPIETVKKIDGVTFNWKEDNDPSMGVIAQNVEKILPEIVSGDDVKSVNYSGLIGLLIETVKDQQKQIDELRGLIDK